MSVPAVELAASPRSIARARASASSCATSTPIVAAGEIVVLLGRSGSGKSTLLNLVSGIDLPDGGRVRGRGRGPDGPRREPSGPCFRRRRIGFVFQFFNLIPTLTVEENLLLPLELTGRRRRRGRRAGPASCSSEVGLADRAASFPDRLSAASSSASPWRGRSCTTRRSCSPTSPPATSTLETARQVLGLLDGSPAAPARRC